MASRRRVGQRPDCHTFLCKFWHFQMAVSCLRLGTYTKHGPGSMDQVHGPPIIFKRKSPLLRWKFTRGQGMKNTDSYFFINTPWLQICVSRVNFGYKINRLFLYMIFNNYSLKWRWLAVDIYRAAKRQGKYPMLATNTEMSSCFSIYWNSEIIYTSKN